MKFAATILTIFFLFTINACVSDGQEENNNNDNTEYTADDNLRTDSSVEVDSDNDNNNDNNDGRKNTSGKIRKLPKFNSLLYSIPGEIVWKQAKKQSLEIQADDEVLEEIVTEVKDGGVLYIGFRSHNFQLNDNKIIIFIATPDIKAVRLSGSGNLRSKGRWEVHDISLAISGSGNFDLNLDAQKVTTELTGSGNVRLKGNTDTHNITVAGSGQVLSYKLQADNCDVNVSGSGSCQVNVDDKLEAIIRGSGSVLYEGNPEVSKIIEGAGSIGRK